MSPTSERLAPASPAMPDDAPVMVHVASRVTEEVFSFLGPATAALKSEGITPMLVTLDDPAARVWLERFDPSVRLVLVPPSWQPLGDQVRLRAAAVRAVRRCRRLEGVHFHGVIPRVLGASVIKAVGPRTPVFFSPHGSRLLGSLSLGGRVVLRFTGWQRGGAGQRTIASHKVDQQRLSAVVDARVNLIESPVPGVFLDIARREAAAPIIIGGSQTAADDEAVEMFTRFAVLLRDTAREAAFCWIGPVSDAQRKLLGTVSATIVPRDDEIERARWLARAWIYLASGGGRGVPVGLTEAMAVGVPCVVADTPFHREIVDARVNGFVFGSEDEALLLIAELLDSPPLRATVGQAGRAEATRRFGDETFRQRLLQVYGRAHASPQAAVPGEAPARAAEPSSAGRAERTAARAGAKSPIRI
ncbi:MAG: glycosyltransferase [Betaproteobacteria bacterium]|nr:glycosyltransferase [Betaproteobacteria bacterium]MCC6247446.1 glycosyltransferase [Rubrivivax sp.]MCL4696955.1 glycosyltransferase [Burkholderiaceae bacterium]